MVKVVDTKNKIYERAIEKWGKQSQLIMLMEECCELAVATSKIMRGGGTDVMLDFAEEIADVKIMIEQMELMFKNKNLSGLIDVQYNKKILRLRKMLVEEV